MGKADKMHFSVTVVLSVGEMQSTSTLINSNSQVLLVTLAKGYSFIICQHFQTISPLKLLSWILFAFLGQRAKES